MVVSGTGAFGQSQDLTSSYDRLINIHTEELKNHLQFPGSKLTPIYIAQVRLQKLQGKSTKPRLYEVLWYRGKDAIGLKRLANLRVSEGETLAINITHKQSNASEQEIAAAADASMRLFLDLYAESNAPDTIIVPASSVERFRQSLEKFGFSTTGPIRPGQSIETSIMLEIQPSPSGDPVHMSYKGRYY